MYYLSIEAYVALGWTDVMSKRTAVGLFLFRLVGVIAFEATGEQYRKLIFFFPNLFEHYFLFYIFAHRFAPQLIPRTLKRLFVVLFLLYVPKFGQEWLLHFTESTPWNWFKETVLGAEPA